MVVDLSRLDHSFADCAEQILTPVEKEQLQGYHFSKRRREWLGGRLACKAAVAGLVGEELRNIVVENDEHGRPFVAGGSVCKVHVSISHSGDVAMGLAASVPCGLDVQKITPSLARVESKFITVAEGEQFAGLPLDTDLERLGLLWAVKEALRKQVACWPLIGFLGIKVELVQVAGEGFMVHCSPVPGKRVVVIALPKVYATLYRGHGLAVCFGIS